jgi:hypothetical protein
MEERKRCQNCGEYLIAFQGQYLHPEKPCSGILDYIETYLQFQAQCLLNNSYNRIINCRTTEMQIEKIKERLKDFHKTSTSFL